MLYDILKTVLLAVGAVVIVHRLLLARHSSRLYQNVSLAVLAAIGAVAVVAYTNFLEVHDYGKRGHAVYHYHDIYHYYLGAKYYSELGYDRLYDCTYIALEDIEREGIAVPNIVAIRSLAEPDQSYLAAAMADANRERCLAAMRPERWGAFKDDLKVFLSLGWEEPWWRTMVFDLGFNPPPSWALFATTLANLVPLGRRSLWLLPFVDMILIFGVAGYFIHRAFGRAHLFAYYLVLGTNWYASYMWTGGSYFRQVWFALLVIAVCLLKMKHPKQAGLLFGLSAALRLFPAAFLVGAIWPLLWAARKPAQRRTVISMSLVFGLTVAVAVGLSLPVFGVERWPDFFDKIGKHNDTFFVMHFGFKKYAVFSDAIAGQDFWWQEGLRRFAAWNERLRALYQDSIVWNRLLQFGVPALTLYAFRRYPAHFASVAIGGSLLFFFSMPANYYYIYLALLAVVAMRTSGKRPTALIAIGIWTCLVAVNLMPFVTKDGLLYNGYTNRILFWLFLALPIFALVESSSRAERWLKRWTAELEKPS